MSGWSPRQPATKLYDYSATLTLATRKGKLVQLDQAGDVVFVLTEPVDPK
ncbi:MAG: hypothetical protein LH650_03005 [Chloroflexi bacterium]|nr:hypothetical protein [Chloroflexota bacterium]